MNIDKIILSDHAIGRCQQRGIPLAILPFVVTYGKRIKSHNDYKSYIPKKVIAKLQRKDPDLVSKYDKQLSSTAVVWNKHQVVTAFKINQRLNWS